MKGTKKITAVLVMIMVILSNLLLSGCTTTSAQDVVIPDVNEVDEASAKNVLSSNSLIPHVVYEYDDYVAEGNVIMTDPVVGSVVAKNTKVTMYVSKGPSYIRATNSTATWTPISDNDEWHWYHPYIQDGIMYINCYSVTFGCAVTWHDRHNDGYLYGEASLDDTFAQNVPVTAQYTKQSWQANESQSFTLEIPVEELADSKPTTLYVRLARSENVSERIKIRFYITWYGNVQQGSTENNRDEDAEVTPTTQNATQNTTQKPTQADQKPTVIYEKINYEPSGYNNKASIEKVDITGSSNYQKLSITYKILECNETKYKSFATKAVFYDADDNVIEISQVMYTKNIDESIGQVYVDETYIPAGTKTILIHSGTKNVQYRVSKNHGNSSVKLDVPKISYDKHGHGNAVEVNSYNVSGRKIFFTYTVKEYYGGSYNSHATDMIFYDSQGAVLETKQALYVNKIDDNAIGRVTFDYTYMPEGTAKIVVKDNKSSNTEATSKPTNSNQKPDEDEKDETKWNERKATNLDNYIASAVQYLTKAKDDCKKGEAYHVLANERIENAAGCIENAIEMLQENGDVTAANGSSMLEMANQLYAKLTELSDVEITTSNVSEYADKIATICSKGAVDAASLRIVSTKFKAEF